MASTPAAAIHIPRKRGRPPKNPPASGTPNAGASATAGLRVTPPDLKISTKPNTVMKEILKSIRSVTDRTGRNLSELFEELVSAEDYPDYYEVIKIPIALSTIENKIEKNQYQALDQFAVDFNILFDNAMNYNRKGSMIYKDAHSLKEFFDSFLKTYKQLTGKDVSVVNTQSNLDPSKMTLSQIIGQVLKQLLSFRDRSGRLICEMFRKLPDRGEYPDYYQEIKRPIALDKIESKLKQNQYSSLREFEEDIDLLTSNAKLYNATDSAIYADAVNVKNTTKTLLQPYSKLASENRIKIDSIVQNGEQYRIGHFVYIHNPNDPLKPTVAQIVTFKQKEGLPRPSITACWYLRPEQTVHTAGTRFMQNEVFKTNHTEEYKADEIIGRCWVLFIRDYVRGKPVGAKMEDVYVCESRYTEQAKQYTRIKYWAACMPEGAKNQELNLELYPAPLIPQKIDSTFFTEQNLSNKIPTSYGTSTRNASWGQPTGPPIEFPHSRTQSPHMSSRMFPGDGYPAVKPAIDMTLRADPLSQSSRSSSRYNQQQKSSTSHYSGYNSIHWATVDSFDVTDDNRLKWFAAPPIDVVDNWDVVNTLDYLYHRAQQKRKAKSAPSDVPNKSPRTEETS
ncbi:Bromodomain-containing protein [Phlyctochytrium arcticum]|nr:Bromodomain-containing protein [Phlyctochytrium arcticum]